MRTEIFVVASELLERAAEAGVFLSYGQERLHFKLSVDVFPESLKSEIIENKAALIEFLRHRELDNGSTVSRPRIVAQAREANEVPVSFAQQRLWLIDRMGGGSPHYNMPGGLRVRGRFNEDIAEQALRRIIERHEPLRTIFRNGEDGPLQQIRESFDFRLARLDLSGLANEEQEQQVQKAANADALKPFDLSADLMLRASFIRLSEEEGVLLFNLHHIASDGWSTGILVNEFSTLYEAFSKGEADPLPPLEVQYADYAQWQREWLEGEVLERQLSYWEQQLAELPQVHGLPLDRPRPAIQTFNGALHSFTLDRSTLTALKQLALDEQATLFMVLQAVFALLLSRHSNSTDIVIGTPVANRLQKELEPLVGFFVNTLVLRSDCRAGRSFRRYLADVKRMNLNAQANQDVPFEYLVERLNPQRSTSHTPLFQIAFGMNTYEAGTVQLQELELVPLRSERVAVKFDLLLDAAEGVDGLWLSFTYNTDLFEESTIARLGEHFQNLARDVAANPEQATETLSLLSAAEQRHMLYELNDTAADYPGDTCLHEMFEAQVEMQPESVAVVFGESRLSYRELNERANQLAHYLREQGIGPDTLVGLCIERSPAMVLGILGILKAGGAYVPLDPSYPSERLESLIEDSAPAILLTQAGTEEYLPVSNVKRLRLDTDNELIAACPTHNPSMAEVGLTAEHLASVIYTSGSTGKPKGVMLEHRGLSNYLAYAAGCYLDGEIEGSVVSSPLSFDATLTSLAPLLVGKTVELLPDDETLLNRLAERLFTAEGNKLFKLTPTHLEMLAYVEQPPALAGARHVIVMGCEQLGAQLLRHWKTELLPKASFVNEYGPTQAAVGCSVWWLRDKAGLEHSAGLSATPIGRPIANTQLYVLDAAGQLLPQNSVGELYIGGEGLARSYLRRAALTAEHFVPNPFATSETTSGRRLYRTGDEVRWSADGNLEFLGRLDQQVKIHGFRIELGEIEAALQEHSAVRHVVVMAREDKPGDKRLVAYVVLKQNEVAITGSELRQYLKSRLPDYMLPATFMLLEALPLLPNGKVDRKALPAPDHARPDIKEAFAGPRTPIEEIMATIWSQILQLENVGIHDNFFSLGGHSLSAAQVLYRVSDTFNVDLPLTVFFETPTVAALAAYIARVKVGEADDATLSAALAELSQLSADEKESLLAGFRISTETRSLA